MRSRTFGLILILGLVPLATDSHGQFNPGGRKRPAQSAPKPNRTTKRAATATPAQRREVLIARYVRAALADPSAQVPIRRLVELYTADSGSIDKLVADFERRAAAGSWNARLALAGVHRHYGETDRAIAVYEAALTERPEDSTALVGIAELFAGKGDLESARKYWERALPKLARIEQESILRQLRTTALEQADWDAATEYHRRLVAAAKGSPFVRAELGRELLARGEHVRAVTALESAALAARGDPRTLAPALRDLGIALLHAGRWSDAERTLLRARKTAGDGSGLARDIDRLLVDVYRRQGRLEEFAETLAKRSGNRPERLALLAELYEETGQTDRALKTYKRLAQLRRRDADLRMRLVRMLELEGRIVEALPHYRAVVRAEPREAEFAIRYAEALMQQGDREAALRELDAATKRMAGDAISLSALAAFYERIGEPQLALRVLEKMAQEPDRQGRAIVELGSRYYTAGEVDKAMKTWERLRQLPDGKRGTLALGTTLLEHGLYERAIGVLRKGLERSPRDADLRKAYARALELANTGTKARARQTKALEIWQALLNESKPASKDAQDARQHIVAIWAARHKLDFHARALSKELHAKPPDLRAGRLLAEIRIRQRNAKLAEAALRTIVKHAPGDAASWKRLEHVLVRQQRLSDAIDVAETIARLEPRKATDHYRRMADYAARLYRDDDALKFTERAVALNPDDPSGHLRLARWYQRKQDHAGAIRELRFVVLKDPQALDATIELAELLVAKGETQEAERLLLQVVRNAYEDPYVARAARLALQLALSEDHTDSLENALVGLSVANPRRDVYRQLLLELYQAVAMPLIQRARSLSKAERARDQERLSQLGRRAIKPLLDALRDADTNNQKVALELLRQVRNPNAARPLVNYAGGRASASLRARAIVAAAYSGGIGATKALREFVRPNGELHDSGTDSVVLAAAWGLAYLADPNARQTYLSLLRSDSDTLRAYAILGLSRLSKHPSMTEIAKALNATGVGPLTRAAGAQALAKGRSNAEIEILLRLVRDKDRLVRSAAMLSLAQRSPDLAKPSIARALFASSSLERYAALSSLAPIAGSAYEPPATWFEPESHDPDLEALLAAYFETPTPRAVVATALDSLQAELATAAANRAAQSESATLQVVRTLMGATNSTALGSTQVQVLNSPTDAASHAAIQRAVDAASEAVLPIVLARLPDADTNSTRALLHFLARQHSAPARAEIERALADPRVEIQIAALQALTGAAAGGHNGPYFTGLALERLAKSSDWAVRAQAARMLGSVRPRQPRALDALKRAAKEDDFALVREAALSALGSGSREARQVLEQSAQHDPEKRVRHTARKILREHDE